ncbi:VOC family protein [Sulfitobacter sp. LCG007]
MSQSRIQCRVRELDHLVLTVANIPETVRFYTQVLGMRGTQFGEENAVRRWALQYGQSKINLHQKGREFEPRAADPRAGSADLCFLTDAPLADWIDHLEAHQVDLVEGPVKRTGARGPINSLYIRDPDGNLIEIAVPEE